MVDTNNTNLNMYLSKVPYKMYNKYERVNIILYSYDENKELQILLCKKKENKETSSKQDNLTNRNFSIISSPISHMDSCAAIACCRVMSSDFFGLFTEENLNKISENKNHDILANDLDFFDPEKYESIPWYRLRDAKSFLYYINKMLSNPIQYDEFQGEMIYLFEMPFLDMKKFNENLEKINYPFEFAYINYENFFTKEGGEKNITLDEHSQKLLSSFNVKEHILDSQILEDIYLMISCVPHRPDDLPSGLLFPLFTGLYRKNKEKWLYYTADKNEFPSDEIIKLPQCKAIIIPGSASNVYHMERHTVNTIKFIKNFMGNPEFNHVKYLGVCFGHQIFSEALGGKVMPRTDPMVHSVEEIQIEPSFWDLDFMKENSLHEEEKRSCYKIKQIHRDDVVNLPEILHNYAKSCTCSNEVFASKDSRILTMQGHPEYTPEFFFFRAAKIFLANINEENENLDDLNEKKYAEKCNKIFHEYVSEKTEVGQIDHEMRAICYHFLKHIYRPKQNKDLEK
jgi:GMP synthase-like glutamine amidotransferase